MNGTFHADGSPDAEYTGGATLYWETTEPYYIGPEGTYTDADSTNGCDQDTLGDGIDATVWVEEVDPENGYIKECESTDAAYSRDGIVIDLTWEGDCEVKDNTGSPILNTGDVDHDFTGELDMSGNITAGVWTYTD